MSELERLRVLLNEWKGHAGRLEAQRNELREERDVAGRVLAEILVAVQPAEHYDHVDVGALVPMVAALVVERNKMRAKLRHADVQNGSQYLSTACIHELHDRCRLECKFCGDACRCACHQEEAPHE